jgi:cytochrome c556
MSASPMPDRQVASPTLKRRISVISSATFAAAVCIAAWAATPAQMLKARHEHYEKLGEAFKAVRDNSKGTPDWAALDKASASIQKATEDQMRWFPHGTGPEAGKTRALPDIWSKPTEFAAAQKLFSERAPALVAAVKAKDADAVGKAFRELGGACKNCHDNFRAPE